MLLLLMMSDGNGKRTSEWSIDAIELDTEEEGKLE